MSIIFHPTGSLNVSIDPSDLPETADNLNIQSGEMVRCKNLRIDQRGIAKTRDGSSSVNPNTQISSLPIWWLDYQGGARYEFSGTHIYRNEVSIETGMANAQWVTIKYNSFNDTTESIFALNGTDRKRIDGSNVNEWGIDAPTDAPVNAVGAATGLTGDYNTKYTYVRKVSGVVVCESNPSPAGNTTTLADQKLSVTVTAPSDSQVTHIRLYRTSAGDDVYHVDQDIAVGSTSFTSSQADADLGDIVETDHDRPPLGSFLIGPAYDGTCFIIKNNLLYYCKPKQPEYWPATYYIEVSTPQIVGKCALFHNGQLYFLTKYEIFYIQGTGNGTFFPLPMKAKTGAQGMRGAVSVAGKGIYHTGQDGIYLYSSGVDTKITEEVLEPVFRGEDTQGIPGVYSIANAILFSNRNYLYFLYMDQNDTDGPSNILVLNMDTNRLAYYEYLDSFGDDIEFTDIHALLDDRVYAAGSDGYVRIIEDSAQTDDDGVDISWEIQSKDFILATRPHFPRWIKYDVDASNATTCQGKFMLNGSVLHTHTITGNRDVKRRLLEVDNGERAAHRITGTGRVSIYGTESE